MIEKEVPNNKGVEVERDEPYLIDYVAGGLLSGGIAWFWSVVLNYLINMVSYESEDFFYFLSIVIYIAISFSISFLVSKKFERGHVVIGLKTSLFSWAVIIFILFPPGGKVTQAITIFYSTLFFCMIIGGYLGGSLSRQIKSREIKDKTCDETGKKKEIN